MYSMRSSSSASKLEYEAKDVAGIDEANNDDVSRTGYRVGKEIPHDAQLDKLTCRIFYGAAGQFRLPPGTSQRIEPAVW